MKTTSPTSRKTREKFALALQWQRNLVADKVDVVVAAGKKNPLQHTFLSCQADDDS